MIAQLSLMILNSHYLHSGYVEGILHGGISEIVVDSTTTTIVANRAAQTVSGGIGWITPTSSAADEEVEEVFFRSIADWVNEWISTQIEQEERDALYSGITPAGKIKVYFLTNFSVFSRSIILLNNAFKYSEPGTRIYALPNLSTEQAAMKSVRKHRGLQSFLRIWKRSKRLIV